MFQNGFEIITVDKRNTEGGLLNPNFAGLSSEKKDQRGIMAIAH